MKSKLMLAIAGLLVGGCSHMRYPGWDQVRMESSVYKQPCEYKIEEVCNDTLAKCSREWFKQRATIYKANTVIASDHPQDPKKSVGEYYYCGSGIPPFIVKPGLVWMIKPNKFNPAATQLDYDKTDAECVYESHKATVDTSKPNPAMVYVPTSNPRYADAQESARVIDDMRQLWHESDLRTKAHDLYRECMNAKGFTYTSVSKEDDFEAVNRQCPGDEKLIRKCFIPNTTAP